MNRLSLLHIGVARIIVVLLIFISTAYAQNKSDSLKKIKTRISFSYFLSIPRGDFTTNNLYHPDEKGLLENGRLLSINIEHQFAKNFSFSVGYSSSHYSFDEATIQDYYLNLDPEITAHDITSDGYDFNAYLLGIKFFYPYKRFRFYARTQFGIGSLRMNEYISYSENRIPVLGQQRIYVRQEKSEKSTNAVYGGEVGVEFYVSDWLNISFIYGGLFGEFKLKANKETVIEYDNTFGESYYIVGEFDKPYNSNNIGLSIGFNF